MEDDPNCHHDHFLFDESGGGGNRMVRQPIGNRFAYAPNDPIPVPQESLEQYSVNYHGAIGTPVEPQYYGSQNEYYASTHSRRIVGGAQPPQSGDMIQDGGSNTLVHSTDVPMSNDAYSQNMDSVTDDGSVDDSGRGGHDVLSHLMRTFGPHDVLQFTEDNTRFSRRFYIDVNHSFFNACMFMTFVAMIMSFATAFIAVIICVCEVEIDLYWYRTIYIVLLFVIGLGIVAITTLHIYRNRNFSKDHVVAITLPALMFVVGAVMCGFGLQWYVNTHGTTIHWHSASQMSALSSILLMNWAWGIIMIPLGMRAIACHYVPEQVESQVAVEIAYTKDEVNASATIRNSAKIARRGMGSGLAQKQ
jgi:hypothetical protein